MTGVQTCALPISGNSGNVTITSGVGQFTIPSTAFTIPGNYTLTVSGIIAATGCTNVSENATANFTINPIPSITGATVSAQATCPNFGSLATISGANALADGTYSITYQLPKGTLHVRGAHGTAVVAHVQAMVLQTLLAVGAQRAGAAGADGNSLARDRKSTRLNSSHPRLSRMPSSA